MFDSLNARLDMIMRDGVKVELGFPMKDYAFMGMWIFIGLFAALVLANLVNKRL